MLLNDFQIEMLLDNIEELAYFNQEFNEEKETQYVFDFLQSLLSTIEYNSNIEESKKEEIKERFKKYDIL
ncbi:hypothetical protein [Colwellia ponticola]|uniref:Uncharacterized protein n=1 Tax=Colwellia ponticola TaxID=2304625 RepID=A0A8H2JL27_9GAMM|nr:hypothetical protein [Colwellia ponticola]TMM45430.1 hypothetical protein FCS21_08555 [Colwellia ponticola]